MSGDLVRASKRLSYHLRHDPEAIGLTLDPAGWVPVDDLLAALRRDGLRIDRSLLDRVVECGSKPRFEWSADRRRIRARYGHSIPVDPGHVGAEPPAVLYHGTAADRVERILEQGLRPMRRRSVHCSEDVATAREVGARHGTPVVLEVAAGAMHRSGAVFTRPAAGVWLVAEVPPQHLRRLGEQGPGR